MPNVLSPQGRNQYQTPVDKSSDLKEFVGYEALQADPAYVENQELFDYPAGIPASAEVLSEHEKRNKQNAEAVELDAQFEVFMRTDALAKGKISD